MRSSTRRSRRTAAVVVTGLLAAGVTASLPATSALAADTVTVVQPANATVANGNSRTVTFQTSDSWFPLSAPEVTLTRANDPSHTDVVEGSGESVSSSDHHRVTATFDLKLANPADYNVSISGTTDAMPPDSATDSCTACLHVVESLPPTATATAPNSVMADDAYPNWVIAGTGFTKGPYVQCTALPCDTSKPSVAVLAAGVPDPNVVLSDSGKSSTAKQIPLELSVLAANTGGQRSILVTNTDGQTATCSNCLAIAKAMTVSTISPDHLAAGSTGQTLSINGANFPTDTQPSFVREDDDTVTNDVTWTSMSVTSSKITLQGVSVSPTADDGNETLVLHSDSTHGNNSFPGLFAVGGTTPTAPSPEGAPTNVTATGGDQQAFVQWTPPTSSSNDPITGYVVKTLPSGSPSTPAPASARSAAVGPLTNGHSYQFTVTVTYQSGHSFTSAASNAATPSGRPDAPTDVHATAHDRSATVTWTAPASSNGTPIDSYTVTSSPDGKSTIVLAQGFSAPPATTTTVSGLKNGTTYTFTVVAHNGGGNSDDSDPSNSVTPKGKPSLTLHAPKALDKGDSTTLRGRLLDSNGDPVGGAKVKLQQRHSGAHQFGPLKVLKSSKHGRWSFKVEPLTTTRYRVKWHGNVSSDPIATGRTVKVRETGKITSPNDGAHVPAGKVTVRGRVTSDKGFPVALQQRRHGKWVTITKGKVGAKHKVSLAATLAEGTAVLRLKVSGQLGTVTGYSPRIKLTVT
jgi:hypothetical protein